MSAPSSPLKDSPGVLIAIEGAADYAARRPLDENPYVRSALPEEWGFPDEVLVRAGGLVFAELKSEKGKLSDEQRAWPEALRAVAGVEVYEWASVRHARHREGAAVRRDGRRTRTGDPRRREELCRLSRLHGRVDSLEELEEKQLSLDDLMQEAA